MIISLENIEALIATVGFPIVAYFTLYYGINKKLDELIAVIKDLSSKLAAR